MNIPDPYLINWYKYTIYPVRLNIFTVWDFYGNPVADPGFPRGGRANSPGGWGGRQHTILLNFPQNCMKLKEFGPRGGVQNFTM